MEHGRWIHQDDSIFSEIELKYLITTLTHMINKENDNDFNEHEGRAIIDKHWDKTVSTL